MKHHAIPFLMETFLLSHSRMAPLKKAALLEGDVLQDLATGQLYKLHPTEEELERGVWEYNSYADWAKWHYVVLGGVTYAMHSGFIDWDQDILEWNPNEMGQWPFGVMPTEEEKFMDEVEEVLFLLDCHLEAELEWMDRIEEEENAEPEEDSSDEEDWVTDDEGYETSPEVDFDKWDYWALGKCSAIWRIQLYLDLEDGYWTL